MEDSEQNIPEAIGNFKPVEILALVKSQDLTKLGFMKQEFSSEVSLRK